jgi:hypothetical protein
MGRLARARDTRPADAGDPEWVALATRMGRGSVLDLRRRGGGSRGSAWGGDATRGGGISRGSDATWRGNSRGGTSEAGQATTSPVMAAHTTTTIAVQERLGISTSRITIGRTAGWMRAAHLSQRPAVKATPRPRQLLTPSSFAWP